jgi:hypothetical protein
MAMSANKLDPQIIEYLIKNAKTPEDIFGEDRILKQLKKALTERILEGELTRRPSKWLVTGELHKSI